ncbi:recombinase family protein [Pedobacter sp. AW1-32]|uniref:recombinase family protein n=1 Tax=Pedobacter sp. AW1-32 TaxID=3383026 RepID=UPI003FF04A30
MKSAYLYVRVSTDEQKRKGYSLPDQEDRLLKYCASHDIIVEDIYREDYSAKNFNRPEWKKLITAIKRKPKKEEKNILFIKWDRFSRNIHNAFEMIGILRKNNAYTIAIDQPIDLEVPESIIMLAVYLSVPEAENTRRALNTANGMRRARQMGRHPNKAPIGFVNLTDSNGKKSIEPKQPEARIIKWIFHQLQKNIYRMSDVWRMALDKGLLCSKSNFSKLIRNPVYCGLIPVKLNDSDWQVVKGCHNALVSVSIFNEVQNIINTRRKVSTKRELLRSTFFLRGFLKCPLCDKKLTGSYSGGSKSKYPYYHCYKGCNNRISAVLLNFSYERELQKLLLSPGAIELFDLVLDDSNLRTNKAEYVRERRELLRQFAHHQNTLSKARNLFVEDMLKFDDYSEFKNEFLIRTSCIKKELGDNIDKLNNIDLQRKLDHGEIVRVFRKYDTFDIADRRHLLNFLPLNTVNFQTGEISLKVDSALSKILISELKS